MSTRKGYLMCIMILKMLAIACLQDNIGALSMVNINDIAKFDIKA